MSKSVVVSLKVKLTTELSSPMLRLASTMSTPTVGFLVSIWTVSEPGSPRLPASSW